MNPGALKRVFIAVEIPAEAREKMRAFAAGLQPLEDNLKAVSEENLHLTLKFLGMLEQGAIEGMRERLDEAAGNARPFHALFSGIGVFPGKKSPRILWAGVSDGGGSAGLKLAVEEKLALQDPEKEEREFNPHVTLGRFRGIISGRCREYLDRLLREAKNTEFGGMRVESFSLMESILRKEGAGYSRIAAFPLGRSIP